MKVVKKFFLLIGLLSFSSTAFGYLEGSFYCDINNTTISVSIQKKYQFTCQSYIKSLEKSLRETYKDILNINAILIRGQDVDYRASVKAKKLKEFDTQQTMYVRVKTSVKNFENNLLEKFKKFFADSTVAYKADLKKKQATYAGNQNSYLQSYLSLVNQQLINIDGLVHAKDLKEIFDTSKKYFYIKTKLDEAWDRYFMKG